MFQPFIDSIQATPAATSDVETFATASTTKDALKNQMTTAMASVTAVTSVSRVETVDTPVTTTVAPPAATTSGAVMKSSIHVVGGSFLGVFVGMVVFFV